MYKKKKPERFRPKRSFVDQCKLCGETKNIKDSHIISKFIIMEIKNIDSQKKLLEFRASQRLQRERQDGPKEYLFCDNCEQFIGISENYVKSFWNDRLRSNMCTLLDVCLLYTSDAADE